MRRMQCSSDLGLSPLSPSQGASASLLLRFVKGTLFIIVFAVKDRECTPKFLKV